MTNHRDLKALIRARMAKTGQSYVTARLHVLRDQERLFGLAKKPAASGAAGLHVASEGNRPTPFGVTNEPRFEFMSIMARLAGYEECSGPSKAIYASEVDAHFSPFKQHAAVRTLERLRQERGFNFWFLLQFTVRLGDTVAFDARLPCAAPSWDPAAQWTLEELDAWRAELRAFAQLSDIGGFLSRHAELYREANRRLAAVVDADLLGKWLDDFYGSANPTRYFLAPALLMGRDRMPAINEFPDGQSELFGFVGPDLGFDARGLPMYGPDTVLRIVEVFCRLRINADVSIHEAALRAGSEATFAVTAPQSTQEPERWHRLMASAISLAILERFARAHGSSEAMRASRDWADPLVFWRRPLRELFEQYATSRDSYPTLGDFMPRVAALFVECAAQAKTPEFEAQRQQALQTVASLAPHVARCSPPDGSLDVDPELSRVEIGFDRQMFPDWSLDHLPGKHTPRLVNDPSFDATKTVFSLSVQLEPETDYGVTLNPSHFPAFADADGHGLMTTTYSFRTGPRRPASPKA
jgi:hypothetical protein